MPVPINKQNLSSLYGHRAQATRLKMPANFRSNTILMGVELEYENTGRANINFAQHDGVWQMVPDHSLRGGTEYILREPLAGEDLAGAIHQFFAETEGCNLVANGRTSCHLHIDMRDAEMEEVRGMIFAYQAAEESFWSITHIQRRWTGYCLPLLEGQGKLVAFLMKERFSERDLNRLLDTSSRYSAFNLISIKKHGSFEFRHFHNPVNKEELTKWINFVQSVKLVGKTIAAKAEALNLSVLEWASGNPMSVVDEVCNDVCLATLCENTPRGAMHDAVERMAAVIEAINVDVRPPAEAVRQDRPEGLAGLDYVMEIVGFNVPLFLDPNNNHITFNSFKPYNLHSIVHKLACREVYDKTIMPLLPNDQRLKDHFYRYLAEELDYPNASNANRLNAYNVNNLGISTNDLLFSIGKAQFIIANIVENGVMQGAVTHRDITARVDERIRHATQQLGQERLIPYVHQAQDVAPPRPFNGVADGGFFAAGEEQAVVPDADAPQPPPAYAHNLYAAAGDVVRWRRPVPLNGERAVYGYEEDNEVRLPPRAV